MSKNHQFIEFEDRIVKRYAKTVPSVLTGLRLNPHRPENRLDWLLTSSAESFKHVWEDGEKPTLTRIGFSYDHEVIELYSDAEVKLFERLNRAAIEQGLLKVYTDAAPVVSTHNALIDADVIEIAKIKQLSALKKRLTTLTSVITVQRVLEAAKTLDRPLSIITAIEKRIDELSSNN